MQLHDGTTLRGFLAHMVAKAKEQAVLYGTAAIHPDNVEGVVVKSQAAARIEEMWEALRRDIPKVLGFDVQLVPYHALATQGSFESPKSSGHSTAWCSNDPYRIRLGTLKVKADKARLKDPSISLLKSWTSKPDPCGCED